MIEPMYQENGQTSMIKALACTGAIIVFFKLLANDVVITVGERGVNLGHIDEMGAAAILASCFGAIVGRKYVTNGKPAKKARG